MCHEHLLEQDLIKPEDIAAMFDVSPRTVMRWVQLGHLPALRIGSVTRIRPADFEAFLQRIHTGNNRNDAAGGRA